MHLLVLRLLTIVVSKRYLYILKAIAEGINSWAEIKSYVTSKSGNIADTRFAYLLDALIKPGFVDKTAGRYSITDPVMRKAMAGAELRY